MKKDIPDEGLQLQKENIELKDHMVDLKSEIRDRDTDILGLRKTIKEVQRQMEQFAITLGVQNDYPTLLGEMEKLLCVEDDITLLRGQMKALQGSDKEEVVKAIVQGGKAIKEAKDEVVNLKDEVKQLKSKRNLDRYKFVELIKEIIKKFFQGIQRLPHFVISKIRGVSSLWN